jgi:hypothetical protein
MKPRNRRLPRRSWTNRGYVVALGRPSCDGCDVVVSEGFDTPDPVRCRTGVLLQSARVAVCQSLCWDRFVLRPAARRPGYPSALYDLLTHQAGLNQSTSVLDSELWHSSLFTGSTNGLAGTAAITGL